MLAGAPLDLPLVKESGMQQCAQQQPSCEGSRHKSSKETAPARLVSMDFSRLRNQFPLVSATSPLWPASVEPSARHGLVFC